MKKECPKCNILHEKNGRFCSRSCANFRVFSEESNRKKSIAQLRWVKENPKRTRRRNSVESYQKSKETVWNKLLNTPFDTLGFNSKRKIIIHEQEGKCNSCGITEWRGEKISLEIDHKNGIRDDNRRDNLEALCPNCHSITDTWRGRNKPAKNGVYKVTDDELLIAIEETDNIRQALLSVGLAAKGNNYNRAKILALDLDK